ncbi:MAG: AMP-binding protein [Vicinamibacterales bacterium]
MWRRLQHHACSHADPAGLATSGCRIGACPTPRPPSSATCSAKIWTFPPSESFRAQALVRDDSIYAEADNDPEAFWAKFAGELEWSTPWTTVLDWQPPHAKWFLGGKINASVNCVDRHVRTARRNKAAIIWEGEPGDRRTLTYHDLYRDVSQFANVLKSLGVAKGDRVALYMPLIPELAIAMLACARIGAVHSVVFGGFSSESLRDRINDAQAKVLVTADGGYRRGQIVPLKQMADEALQDTPSITSVVIVQRGDRSMPVHVKEGRDHWYHRLMQDAPVKCDPEPMDAEDMLYILYTSGTTGKPKGIVHTTGGYLTGTYATTKLVFDMKDDDVYWCTADIGWVTGHSYVVYGPLSNGATVLMYEGAPDWPQKDRFWSMIEKYGVTILLHRADGDSRLHAVGARVARQARPVVAASDRIGRRTDQSGSVGLVLPLHRRRALPGRRHLVADGNRRDHDHAAPRHHHDEARIGLAAVPGHLSRDQERAWRESAGRGRTARDHAPVAGNAARHLRRSGSLCEAYWNRWGPSVYVTGDGAKLDRDGNYWLLGRVDDVLNVAGHRIGTMEVESALVDHPERGRSGCRRQAARDQGAGVAAFVTLKEGFFGTKAHVDELAITSARRSARSPSRTTSSSPPISRRPGQARSCVVCCAISPKARPSAIRRHWPIRL